MQKVTAADLDHDHDKIKELLGMPHFGGYTASRCSECGATANVTGGAGWFCPCGNFNLLPWYQRIFPLDEPTYGPPRATIERAIAEFQDEKTST